MLTIHTEAQGPATIVRLAGELATGDVEQLQKTATKLMEQAPIQIVFELSRLQFLTSAGLGTLVQLAARANSQHGRAVLASVSPFVSGVLETTRLEKFFEVYPSVEEALRAVGTPK
ncbi:MAG: STAS domain-containing protein [Phycisphaerae bacterium]|nr:STAS domain-containing protein [Phycisphaerae bacterium]